MNWKYEFSNVILQRGRAYFKSKYVQSLKYEKGIFTARVRGEHVYDVTVKFVGEEVEHLTCSCPYARGGAHCKHMAAVLYAIEDRWDAFQKLMAQEELPAEVPNEVQEELPFQETVKEYRYFDMAKITFELDIPGTIYAKAKQMLKKEQVTLGRVNLGYQQNYDYYNRYEPDEEKERFRLVLYAEGNYKVGQRVHQIRVWMDKKEVIQADCYVSSCSGHLGSSYSWGRKYACEHIVALLLLIEDYIKVHNPGDSTDYNGDHFFYDFRNSYKNDRLLKMVDAARDLTVEPVLDVYSDHLELGIKAGCGKMYMVKNLSEFVRAYKNRGKVTFGTKTEVDFAKHRLQDEEDKLYGFVEHIVDEEENRVWYLKRFTDYYIEEKEIKGRVALFGERMEQFYELMEGQTVAGNDKRKGRSEKILLQIGDAKPMVHLEVQKDVDDAGVFHGVKVTGTLPTMFSGQGSPFFLTESGLHRMDREMLKVMQPLFAREERGRVAFYVGRKHLSEFYYQVLPVLKKYATVTETERTFVQQYIPPEPKYGFYLDVEQGIITCRAAVFYGEQRVSLLDSRKSNYVYEPFRNRILEEEALQEVLTIFPEINLFRDELSSGENEEQIFTIIESGVDRLMALGEVHTTDRFRNMNIRRQPKISVGVAIESDIMNLSVSCEDMDPEELLQILQSYQRKKKYYRLKNGDFVAVNEADVELLGQMMEAMHLSPKEFVKGNMKIPVYRALYLNKMLEQSEDIYLNRDTHFKNLIKEFKTVEESAFEVPDSLASIMRNYQVRGFQWLKTLEQYRFGGILADDMGLGKTLQMISVLLSAKDNAKKKEEAGTALIVAPASLVYNWKEEFKRFAPQLRVQLVVGTQQERAEIIHRYQECDVLVTSYDLLKRDVAEYEGICFSYQVLDEAQYIKNHSTAAAKSVKVIQSRQRFALTGTPIENRLSELWSIFDYLMPGFLYGYETFRKELETPIVKHKDQYASDKLKRMVAPFILRRLKGDVLKDLPDKIEEIRYAKLESKQQQLYDGQVVHMKELIAKQDAEDFQKNKLQVLAELTKIRQICCDPELLFEKYSDGSAKREACMDLIKSAIEGEHKILVFSQFTTMLELLEQDLNREQIAFYKITGATPKEKRVEMVSAFNSDTTPVFLISLKAGGTGLNLTGADVVIHYDPWWNQAVQNQATDRAHRIGQKKVVSVYKIIAKDTIEEKIVKMQESKRDLADTILSGETGGISQLSKDELLELLTN